MSTLMQKPRTGTTSAQPQQPQRVLKALIARRMRTLKGQFIVHAGLILLLATILTLVGAATLSRTTNDLNTINSGSVPSVDAAQQITQLIEDIDAQSADYLATASLTQQYQCSIAGTSDTPMYTVHGCDERNIDAETVLVNQQLFEAEHNTTYTGERTAVERISIGLESYLGDIHEMRVDFGRAQSKTNPNDPDLQKAYQAYLAASNILHNQISLPTVNANGIPFNTESGLPTCTVMHLKQQTTLTPDQWTRGGLTESLDCLSYINYNALQNAYSDSSSFLGGQNALLIVLCILFCLLLIAGAGRVMFTTHRFINLGLLAATLIAIIFSISSVALLGSLQGLNSGGDHSQDGAFTQMVNDDYASVYYAALLNRYATDANADESRWLIAQEFNDQPNIQHWQTDWDSNVQEINYLTQQAHANRTWSEEDTPLSNMDSSWQQYYGIDGQMRTAANNQSDPNHILTAEGLSTGQSNQAFGNFTTAVNALSDANRTHYNSTLQATSSSLMLYFLLSLVLFPLTGLLAAWGVWVRLKDF